MEKPKGKYFHGPVPETGLTILFEPDKPSLDIVFIHGFTGHPERTWTSKNRSSRYRDDSHETDGSTEPPHKIRKFNPFHSSHPTNDTVPTNYWPRDLVPITIPDARILTYGYDTHVRHWTGSPINRSTVYDMAWDLLVVLESMRRTEPLRPVLFVAHSLGGIMIKEMLRRSKGCHMGQVHLRDIFESTVGIMFFGTPHAGADPRGFLQRVAEKAIKAAGFSVNEQVVNTLLPSSERLRELRVEFGPMGQERNWIIHSFQEQVGVRVLNYQKVVEDTSSCLGCPTIEVTQYIEANHMQMCRFTGFDKEYEKVAAALRRMIAGVSGHSSTDVRSLLSEEQNRVLLDSLKFDQIDARHMTIKNAHSKTCRWLLKKSEFRDWLDPNKLDEHHGFLWIKGKPGAGKSTLMKFILANSRKNMKKKTIISFFFNARGDDLEKSTVGIYRSLLLQLLEQLPGLQRVFGSLGLATWNSGCHQWSIEALKELFEQALKGLGESSLVCFIDALDECDERQIRDMISFFEHLGELTTSANIEFRVCFSSRHYPHITIKKGVYLVLEGQEGHSQDIVDYLNSELKIGHSKLAEQIRDDLKEKAAGVFMWIVLVVRILNKEHDGGRIHTLRQRLRDIPGDLHELFRDILTRDQDNKAELLLCIQWVLFAKQPLKPEQLYFAIHSGIEPGALSAWDRDYITEDIIRKFILSSSKGLAEITKSKTSTVQFIHESVRDFLKENELKEIWPDLGKDFQGKSHERLKQCCLDYMKINISTHIDVKDALPKAMSQEAAELRQSVTKAFPFLEYAVQNVLYHANAAEGDGVDQTRFLETFQIADWIKVDNLFEKNHVRRHTPNAKLLYILAEHNMGNLVKCYPSDLASSCFEAGQERYGLPILAALATKSDEAVQIFSQALVKNAPSTSPLHSLYKQHYQDENKRVGIGHIFDFAQRKGVLYHILEQGNELITLAFLIRSNKLDPEFRDHSGRTLLSWASGNGHQIMTNLLLENGADIESKDNDGKTPLLWAVCGKQGATVNLLLKKGADFNSKDERKQSPLTPLQDKNYALAELLLEKGADTEHKDNSGASVLSLASRSNELQAVGLLLDKGADLKSRDNDGRTPLSWAAWGGHEATVKMLLERGADLKSRDNDGRTPLLWAAMEGNDRVVKTLLGEGADKQTQDTNGWTPLSWVTDGLKHR
ncbi:hypothetical protein F5B19DRAFT_285669 [Rostrohypoxylon terebratum]|nr:hypothetical protein F5B19DRAFT_285669 [Rostrohypoxylon terebratum]